MKKPLAASSLSLFKDKWDSALLDGLGIVCQGGRKGERVAELLSTHACLQQSPGLLPQGSNTHNLLQSFWR